MRELLSAHVGGMGGRLRESGLASRAGCAKDCRDCCNHTDAEVAIRVDEEGLLFPIRHWAPWLGAMAVMPFLLAPAGAEDLDAGKPPARLFSSNCTSCHQSPRGLARDMSSRALTDFLRQHYSTGANTASALAGYLLGQPGEARGAKPSVREEDAAPAGRSGARARPAAAAEPAHAPDAQAEAAPDQRPAGGKRRHVEPPAETTARPAAEAEPASAAQEAAPQKPRRKGQARAAEPAVAEPPAAEAGATAAPDVPAQKPRRKGQAARTAEPSGEEAVPDKPRRARAGAPSAGAAERQPEAETSPAAHRRRQAPAAPAAVPAAAPVAPAMAPHNEPVVSEPVKPAATGSEPVVSSRPPAEPATSPPPAPAENAPAAAPAPAEREAAKPAAVDVAPAPVRTESSAAPDGSAPLTTGATGASRPAGPSTPADAGSGAAEIGASPRTTDQPGTSGAAGSEAGDSASAATPPAAARLPAAVSAQPSFAAPSP